ncbi:hypothetical protein Ferp_1417 [Ferroglobus placidus DSM 10642]|uniref:Poly(3-hydroxyalkanoate) polymerase subunit PhaE n=1 Tax=Ferroglobus placidus (strain DSM 10642 / AEDII12DO) TaxID=589924 RepID=D3RYK5_FERPA|nr:hypothetical protein [Ferroglobus placidus]ADC65568.1 hypothetical protein Ferp_1417 [Ferroglobus placidus DSM 10642]
MVEEFWRTYKKLFELYAKLSDPRTYFGELTEEEINESLSKIFNGFAKLGNLNLNYLIELYGNVLKGNPEEVLKTNLDYLEKLEDTIAEIVDNPLYSAYINFVDRVFLNYLITLQNINNAIFHSIGIPTRRDIVALSEAYVDLKGDLKKEFRALKKEIEELKAAIGGEKK